MKRYFLIGIFMSLFTVGMCFNYSSNVQAFADTSENLITNGNLDDNMNGWGTFTVYGGKADLSRENDELKLNVDDWGDKFFSIQINYERNFKLYKNGVYKLEFDIRSTADRWIYYTVNNSTDYSSYDKAGGFYKIGNEKKTVEKSFTMTSDTNETSGLALDFGNMAAVSQYINGEIDNPGPHYVYIDNVKLTLIDDSEVDYGDEEEVQKEPEQRIVCNQIGYKCNDIKKAVFRGETSDRKFNIVDADTDKTVYEGDIYGTRTNESSDEIVSYGDFSDFKTPGKYKIKTENMNESYEFTIGNDIYNNLFKDAMRFFYLQRCGEDLDQEHAGDYAHKECHNNEAVIYGSDKKIDVSGGWHDAADYGRYVVSASKAVADLLDAYNDNSAIFTDNYNIPESGNSLPDVLDEVKGEIEWLLKMQDSESGGVYHKVTTAEFAGNIMPQEDSEQLIVCPISTAATGDFCAVMAMAYENFKDIDNELADKCLNASEKAWTYLENTPNSGGFRNPQGIGTGEYDDIEDSDERYWAAAQLFKATKDEKYNNAFKELIKNGQEKRGYGWQNVAGYGNDAYLKAEGADYNVCRDIENSIVREADEIIAASKNDGYGISNGNDYYWGSNLVVNNTAVLLTKAYEIKNDPEYIEYAHEHLNYCLGKNSLGKSFVTGYGTNCVKHPYHTISKLNKTAIPGMIVGGPNDNRDDTIIHGLEDNVPNAKCYVDNDNSFSVNEVDISWNSAFIRALAETERY